MCWASVSLPYQNSKSRSCLQLFTVQTPFYWNSLIIVILQIMVMIKVVVLYDNLPMHHKSFIHLALWFLLSNVYFFEDTISKWMGSFLSQSFVFIFWDVSIEWHTVLFLACVLFPACSIVSMVKKVVHKQKKYIKKSTASL